MKKGTENVTHIKVTKGKRTKKCMNKSDIKEPKRQQSREEEMTER